MALNYSLIVFFFNFFLLFISCIIKTIDKNSLIIFPNKLLEKKKKKKRKEYNKIKVFVLIDITNDK
jgi:hypothetical protein